MSWFRLTTVLFATVFYFGLCVNSGLAQWLVDDDGCRTPDRGTGNCVNIKQCQPMVTALKQLKRPVSPEVQAKLEAYSCGLDKGVIKVCCPSGPIVLTDQTQKKQPVDVTNHKNINLLPKTCGYYDPGNRIINGENALLNEFPWMALLYYTGGRTAGFKCGGTIINKNYILTAAHCLANLGNKKVVSVRVGEHSIKNETDCALQRNKKLKCNPPVQNLRIEEVIPHADFDPKAFTNDIGLIRVSTMNLDLESTRPVCLPLSKDDRELNYTNVIVTGWGVTDPDTGATADILQKVRLPIADRNKCASLYKQYQKELQDYQICAGGVLNKDSCPGDSGGPMVAASVNEDTDTILVQQGVVSFGPSYCGLVGYPGVYTLTIYYMDWILDNLRP